MVEKDINISLGLNNDRSPLNQPKGTYRYAKNVVTDKSNLGSLVNEQGQKEYLNIEGNWLGSCFISPNEQVIFTDANYIYLLNTDTTSLTSFFIEGANFVNPIKAKSRIVNGCERVVYWCDDLNPDRFFNFDKINNFKTNDQFDLDKFLFKRNFLSPVIKTEIQNFGGNLRYGVYNFVVQYLDEDENILYTSPVDINYSPISDSLNSGALNIDTNDAIVGGKPEEGKSIKLTITGLEDTDYIRIGVLRATTSDGFTSDAHIVNYIIDVSGDSKVEYVYSGFNPERGDYFVDKGELLVPLANYKTAKAMEQVQNVLIKGNLTETVYDYSEFQTYANDVIVKWVAKKEPLSITSRTRMGGDIKPLGIVYIHEDYSESPVFLLQPKGDGSQVTKKNILEVYGEINSSYSITYTSSTTAGRNVVINGTLNELREVLFTSVDEIEIISFNSSEGVQYRIYPEQTFNSLASIEVTPDTGYDYSGLTGVKEIVQEYTQPINFDCKENVYWGSENGNRVKLHVFPDRSQIPLVDLENQEAYNIGLKFENINYPDGIIGHYFVEGVESNIAAKGLHTPLEDADRSNTRGSYFHVYDGENPKAQSDLGNIITPNFIYNKEYVGGSRLVEEGQFSYSYKQSDITYTNIFKNELSYDDLDLDIRQYRATEYVQTIRTERTIEESFIVRQQAAHEGFVNYSKTNPFNVLRFSNRINYDRENIMRYVSVYKDTNPYVNMFSFRFRKITDVNKNISFAGDAFIGPFALFNVVETNYNTVFLAKDDLYWDAETIDGVYIESFVNTNLLHDGTDQCNKHYPSTYGPYDGNNLVIPSVEIIWSMATTQSGNFELGNFELRAQPCPIWNGYNKDYSRISDFNIHRLLPRSYDFCSDCLGSYPNRIIFSEKAFTERLQDNYRIIKANNYIDLPANKGGITAIDYKDGQLWVRTEHSCFVITPNPQQLNLSETTVNIGTGDFLSLPEQELNAVDIGYGGQKHIHESINTDHGLIWRDSNRGKVLKVAGGLEEISRNGMYEWFFNLPKDNNIVLGYDPNHERIILTHLGTGDTISYCFMSKMWKSYHEYTYRPDFYLYDGTLLYSGKDGVVYSHNGDYLPTTMEVFFQSNKAFHPDSVHYYANTNFNKLLAYNSSQTSGYQDLVLVDRPSIFFSTMSKYQYKDNDMYKVSMIRDIKDTTNDNPPLDNDRVANIDENTFQFNQGYFNEKWIAIDLMSDENKKIVLDYITTLKHFTEINVEV